MECVQCLVFSSVVRPNAYMNIIAYDEQFIAVLTTMACLLLSVTISPHSLHRPGG